MTSDEPLFFARLLQRYRTRTGLTQEELAERAGLSGRAISDLERGVKTRPRAYTVRQLSVALDLANEDRTVFEDAARGRLASGPQGSGIDTSRPPVGSFLGSLPEGPLIAREGEREALVTSIKSAAAGRGGLVLLRGEPGAGKTRLAQEAAMLARDRSFLCAFGRCHAPDFGASFTPVLDVFSALYVACPPALREEVPRRWPYLVSLLPEAGIAPPPAGVGGPDERQWLFRSAARFLGALADARPVAVLLDDLHWADESTLTLLAHLARDAPAHRLLLLGTYREAEVSSRHPLAALARDLQREDLVTPVPVDPLSLEGTEALLAAELDSAHVPPALVEHVHRLSDGNPFFIRHLLRSLQERGFVMQAQDAWTFAAPAEAILPEGVRAVIEGRLGYLGEATVEVLRDAGVLGQTFSFPVLHAMSGRPEAEVEASLDEADRAGLIHPLDADTYGFDHALTRQTLLVEISPRRLRRLHLAAADALEHNGSAEAPTAALAWHLRQGGALDRALGYELEAGDEAAGMFAHEEAAAHYRLAAELARGIGDAGREAPALERLGRMLRALAKFDESVAACEEAIERYRELDDLEGEGRATAVLAEALVGRGTAREGHARVRSLLTRFEGRTPSSAVAALYIALAPSRDAGSPEEFLAAAERASEVARTLGDERLLATAGVRRGLLLMVLGRPEAARHVLEEVFPLVERAADYSTRNLALGVLSELLKLAGAFPACRARREEMVRLAESMGDPVWRVTARAQLGEICFLLGSWDEARDHLQCAAELGRSLPDPHEPAFALTGLAELCLAQGQLAEATSHLETCLAAVHEAGYGHWVRIVQRLLAQRDLLTGHPDEAIERLQAVAPDEGEGHAGSWRLLAWAELERGDLTAAEAASHHALDIARSRHNRLDLCETLLVVGRIAARLGVEARAEESFSEAAALAEDMPCPYASGRVQFFRGLALRPTVPERARDHLETAMRIFDRLGAHLYAQRTAHALRMGAGDSDRSPQQYEG